MSDQEIVCSDCGSTFPFSESERVYFEQKGLVLPRRCKPCRQARKARSPERAGGGKAWESRDAYRSPMPTGGGDGNYRSPMGGGGYGSQSEYRSPMDGGARPEARGAAPRGRGRGAGFAGAGGGPRGPRTDAQAGPPRGPRAFGPRPSNRPNFEVTCGSCGTRTTVPFEPVQGRDVYCRDCYKARRGQAGAQE